MRHPFLFKSEWNMKIWQVKAISITTTITTDITDATTITTTSSTNTNLPRGMWYWWYRDLIFGMTALNRELIYEMDFTSNSVFIRYIWPPLGRHGISVSAYTILEIFFTPPHFPKITRRASKAKNYCTTKKKVLRAFTPPKIFFYLRQKFFTTTLYIFLSSYKEFYTTSKNFTPSWMVRMAAYSMSASVFIILKISVILGVIVYMCPNNVLL